jgi:hypothetical protein
MTLRDGGETFVLTEIASSFAHRTIGEGRALSTAAGAASERWGGPARDPAHTPPFPPPSSLLHTLIRARSASSTFFTRSIVLVSSGLAAAQAASV